MNLCQANLGGDFLNNKPEEESMLFKDRGPSKSIIDLEKMIRLKSCAACNRPFNLGDPVVLACGAWEGSPKFIHENEAVYDAASGTYFERKCYSARGGKL